MVIDNPGASVAKGENARSRDPLTPLARTTRRARSWARRVVRRWARRDSARLAALYDFATLLVAERDLDRLLAALVVGLAERFGYCYVSAFLLEEGRLRLRAQVGYATPIADLGLGEGITGIVGRDGRATLVRDGRRHRGYLFAEEHFGSQASVPLGRGGRILGVLNLEGGIGELVEGDLHLLEALAAPIAVAIENAALLARLAVLATRDPLTGLLNRRGILDALAAALSEAASASPVTILAIDLDGFKQINDRHGHAAGDAFLSGFADLLAASVGADGTTGRLGGDEFLVVLPGTDAEAAGMVATHLAAASHDAPCPLPGLDRSPSSALGYSLGLATAIGPGAEAATLLARADRAMYEAKRATNAPESARRPSDVPELRGASRGSAQP
jgi:diguanylate cyclase (GGDEF)-like protein